MLTAPLRAPSRWLIGLATCTMALNAWSAADLPVQPNERLSDWLLRRPAAPGLSLIHI